MVLENIGLDRKTKEKRNIKINYVGIVEGLLLIGIMVTCVTVEFITVPIFLSIIFLLIQLKKYVNYVINKDIHQEVVK